MHFQQSYRYVVSVLKLTIPFIFFVTSQRKFEITFGHSFLSQMSKIITQHYPNLNHEITWSSNRIFLIPKDKSFYGERNSTVQRIEENYLK